MDVKEHTQSMKVHLSHPGRINVIVENSTLDLISGEDISPIIREAFSVLVNVGTGVGISHLADLFVAGTDPPPSENANVIES